MTLSDAADWSKIASVGLALLQVAITAGMIYLRKEFVSKKHCDKKCQEAAESRAEIEKSQAVMEQTLRNTPNGRDMSAIKDQLAELSGNIKAMNATTSAQSKAMERVTHQLDLLLENELTGGKR